jgi:alkanesulfonate monooxygenase SsuD/methylene tetrahydromethanopterin reductase-like flavin-dependent oxidoreductase (luciferase family)
MSKGVAVVGIEEQVAEQFSEAFAWGAGELMVSIVPAGADRDASRERALKLLADLAGTA